MYSVATIRIAIPVSVCVCVCERELVQNVPTANYCI